MDGQYEILEKKYQELLKENTELKALLLQHGIRLKSENPQSNYTSYSTAVFPAVNLSPCEKVTLFRSIFKGREDVFARRWYSKSFEKSGYQPVCENEWRVGTCDKKSHRCTDCPNRNFQHLGDNDIYKHLEGKDKNCCDVVGLYAITDDNCCYFLCADFDDKSCEHGYQKDVLAYVNVCDDWNIPCSVERSRSGNGAHVWIFFETKLPAYKARRLGNAILTEAMSRDGRMSFNSYDRLFPNQDFLPDGGFGNLVALPLQGQSRRAGNSIFVDKGFLPYRDQWAYLSQIKKIGEAYVNQILSTHKIDNLDNLTTSSETKPWESPTPQNISTNDFAPEVNITKADGIYIPTRYISSRVVNHLKRVAAFKNPEFYSKQAMRLSTYSIPRIISCADVMDKYVTIPRGCEDKVIDLLNTYGVRYNIVDKTNHGQPINVSFNGEERPEQLEAVNSLLMYTNGVLSATTAFGKTVTAASLIAHRKVNTLVLVHTKALLEQWHERLSTFLDIEYVEPECPQKRGRKKRFSPIGCLDSSSNTIHGIIDIALMQSCFEDGEVKSFVKDYGMVIVDECHHVSSVTFEKVLKSVRAQYVYGLTATPIRKDGHQPIIFMQCGSIRFSADVKSQIEKQSFKRYLVPRFTSFHSLGDDIKTIVAIEGELAEDELRNKMIVDDVLQTVSSGRTPIILTKRKSHVELLCNMISPLVENVVQLTGTSKMKEKREAMQKLYTVAEDKPLVVIATGKYVGEGFDFPRLDTLMLASPISWKGLLTQYVGRLHRESDGKADVRVYDYIDFHVPYCESMYRKRLKGYSAMGYKIMNRREPMLFDDQYPVGAGAENQIFNGKTFRKQFSKDISSAKHSIVISSPKLNMAENKDFIPQLEYVMCNGVEVVVVAAQNCEQADCLKKSGFTVKAIHGLSLSCVVIDKAFVWYGGLDIFGDIHDTDDMIRINDSVLAGEFLDELFRGE
jgi:superfamily II DNA or RNA helicase